MDQRTCTQPGCERPHVARGMCSSHYGTWHRQTHGRKSESFMRTCVACSATFSASARAGRYCSQLCRAYDRFGPQVCPWSPPKPRVVKVKPEPFREDRQCLWCGAGFTAMQRAKVYCSKAHKRKAMVVRRRGWQHGWTSHYTWSEVMKVWLKFDKQCAYCGHTFEGLPDPDHVVPLSKGGPNSITNILPSCHLCNSDKRDLSLSEWAVDRQRRGLEPLVTRWTFDDPRVAHLTSIPINGVGADHQEIA